MNGYNSQIRTEMTLGEEAKMFRLIQFYIKPKGIRAVLLMLWGADVWMHDVPLLKVTLLLVWLIVRYA